jgi:hypothetical protein
MFVSRDQDLPEFFHCQPLILIDIAQDAYDQPTIPA